MTNLNKSKEQIVYELLLSLNNGNNGYSSNRVNGAIEQYEQLIEKGIVVEDSNFINEEKENNTKNQVQIVSDNYDILKNPNVKTLYPNLYKEIYEHDKLTNSSWYDLSQIAYQEYQSYKCNRNIVIAQLNKV